VYEFDEKEQVDETRSVITVNGDEVRDVENFKHFVQKNESFDEHVKYKIRCGWMKWK